MLLPSTPGLQKYENDELTMLAPPNTLESWSGYWYTLGAAEGQRDMMSFGRLRGPFKYARFVELLVNPTSCGYT